ncbi:MAG: cell wall metabolism sensor histidine kinase WalK [Desulfosudis oleivorans]|nr:cell wall metabolism sensor histidine kinase WalK [Desulfosudis oleivorans]
MLLKGQCEDEIVYETIERTKPRLRMVTIPIMDNKKVTSVVQVGTSLEDFDETIRKLLLIMIISIPTSISVTIVVGYFMAKKALRPVDQIRRAAVKISSSNLDEKIDITGRRDELGQPCRDIQRHDRKAEGCFPEDKPVQYRCFPRTENTPHNIKGGNRGGAAQGEGERQTIRNSF